MAGGGATLFGHESVFGVTNGGLVTGGGGGAGSGCAAAGAAARPRRPTATAAIAETRVPRRGLARVCSRRRGVGAVAVGAGVEAVVPNMVIGEAG
jgi:hypothetical protein